MCGVGGQMMPPAGVGAGPQMHASGIHISPANPFAQVGESLHVSIINLPRFVFFCYLKRIYYAEGGVYTKLQMRFTFFAMYYYFNINYRNCNFTITIYFVLTCSLGNQLACRK